MAEVALTLDVDWAPEIAIDSVAEQLVAHRVRATWFITHMSPAVERLRRHPELFELGIHPNFLQGSSHGDTPSEVLRHCLSLVPDAISMRTHALVQSTPIFDLVMEETPIRIDVSLFLPRATWIRPVEYLRHGRVLVRVPYFWEDDFEMARGVQNERRLAPLLSGPGLKVFVFHPIHVYLNSARMAPYESLKWKVPRLAEAAPGDVAPFIERMGEGMQTLFMELVKHLADHGGMSCVRDLRE